MKAHTTSLINAITLIIFGLWGYFGSINPSYTAFIPVVGGIILIFLYPGTKRENKLIAHITVTLTLFLLLGLIKPLTGAIGRSDSEAIFRVAVMMFTNILAIISFIKSFIDARKNREA